MIMQHPSVSGVFIEVKGNEQKGAVPGRPISPSITPAAGGHDAGKFARGLLLIIKIIDPFFIDRSGGVVEKSLFGRQMRIAGPAILLTMRTVGRSSLQLA